MKDQFIQAIKNKYKVYLTFYSKEDKQEITRLCAPMDYRPSSTNISKGNRYILWDYGSDENPHFLSLPEKQIKKMEFTDIPFEPAEFTNNKNDWHIPRVWL